MHWWGYTTQSKASSLLKRQEIDRVKTSDWFLQRPSITPLIWPRFQWTTHPATFEQGWGKRTPSSSRSSSNPRSLSISFSSRGRISFFRSGLNFHWGNWVKKHLNHIKTCSLPRWAFTHWTMLSVEWYEYTCDSLRTSWAHFKRNALSCIKQDANNIDWSKLYCLHQNLFDFFHIIPRCGMIWNDDPFSDRCINLVPEK